MSWCRSQQPACEGLWDGLRPRKRPLWVQPGGGREVPGAAGSGCHPPVTALTPADQTAPRAGPRWAPPRATWVRAVRAGRARAVGTGDRPATPLPPAKHRARPCCATARSVLESTGFGFTFPKMSSRRDKGCVRSAATALGGGARTQSVPEGPETDPFAAKTPRWPCLNLAAPWFFHPTKENNNTTHLYETV